MADPLDNVNEVLEGLEEASIQTSQGSFVRVEHVRRLLEGRKAETEKEREKRLAGKRPPRDFHEARKQIKEDPDIMEHFPSKGPRELGKSVAAIQPQPPSRA